MKKNGFSLLEVTVSISLFLLIIFPTIMHSKKILEINRKFHEIEKTYQNFEALHKQLSTKKFDLFKNNLGDHHYIIEKNLLPEDELTKDLFFLYPPKDGDTLNLNITKVYYKNSNEKREYIELNITYTNIYKIFSIRKLISFYQR